MPIWVAAQAWHLDRHHYQEFYQEEMARPFETETNNQAGYHQYSRNLDKYPLMYSTQVLNS